MIYPDNKMFLLVVAIHSCFVIPRSNGFCQCYTEWSQRQNVYPQLIFMNIPWTLSFINCAIWSSLGPFVLLICTIRNCIYAQFVLYFSTATIFLLRPTRRIVNISWSWKSRFHKTEVLDIEFIHCWYFWY